MKEVSIGGDGSTDVVEQVACIHWWPCTNIKGLPLVEVQTQLAKLFQSYHCVWYVCVCVRVCVCVCVCAYSIATFLRGFIFCASRWEALHKWQ